MKNNLPLFLFLLVLLACQRQPKEQSFNKAVITAEIKQMFDNYHADIARDGLTAEFAYLDSTNEFYWVPPGYLSALSYDSVRTILEGNAKAFQAVNFSWETLKVFPLSNEIATYTGIVNSKMTDTAGTQFQSAIIESGTLIKRADGWKLLCGQSRINEAGSKN